MRRLLLLLIFSTASLVACATTRRPPNDEITIRWTAPPQEAKSSTPAERVPPEQCAASRPSR